eukprot:4689145-Pleurochrysis_carterae.AAC.1
MARIGEEMARIGEEMARTGEEMARVVALARRCRLRRLALQRLWLQGLRGRRLPRHVRRARRRV